MKPMMLSLGGCGVSIGKDFDKTILANAAAIEKVEDAIRARREARGKKNPDLKYSTLVRSFLDIYFVDTLAQEVAFASEKGRSLVIGDGEGSGHDPKVGREAFEKAKDKVLAILQRYDTAFIAGSLNKGTAAGGLEPACDMALANKMFTVAIVVFPDIEEVSKEQYNFAIDTLTRLAEKNVRCLVINNATAYELKMPKKKAWKELNRAAVRGLITLFHTFIQGREADGKDTLRVMSGGGNFKVGHTLWSPEMEASPDRDTLIVRGAREVIEDRYYDFVGHIGRAIVTNLGPMNQDTTKGFRKQIAAIARGEKNMLDYKPIFTGSEYAPTCRVAAIFCTAAKEGQVFRPQEVVWKTPALVMPDEYSEGYQDEDEEEESETQIGTTARSLEVASEELRREPVQLRAVPPQFAAPARVTVGPISFQRWISGMNSEDPVCLKAADEGGVLSDLVKPSLPEVVEWTSILQFRNLISNGLVSKANQDWIYGFCVENAKTLREDSSFQVGLDGLTRRIQLYSVTAAQLELVKDDVSNDQQKRMIRFLKSIAQVWGPEKAMALLNVENSRKHPVPQGSVVNIAAT